MTSLQDKLSALIARIDRPGDFYATGTLDMHPPRLRVEGVGTIALPLLPVQAEPLIAVAEQAPYGRGSETLVDTEVRRTWQIDAARLTLEGQRWQEDLSDLIPHIADDLGVTGQVEAELYKLLIYDAGSFFVSHRDTEKCPGMFATLVMILPSEFSGGELIVRHQSREVRLDLHREDPSAIAYAAFYADCRHQVLPITDGCRLALIYNLFRRDGGPLPQAPNHDSARNALTTLLHDWNCSESWSATQTTPELPRKLILPLEHSYTEAELGFHTLKGIDATLAGIVLHAAEQAHCDLHLAMLNVHESGWAEYSGYGRWNDDMEIGEVDSRAQELHTWRRPDQAPSTMGALPFERDEVCSSEVLDEIDDTEPEFEEATGNEGASFERQYQRAALVLWPRHQRAAQLASGGLDVSLPGLSELLSSRDKRSTEAGSDAEAKTLAQAIRAHWPESAHERLQASRDGQSAAFLSALHQLGDTERAVDFITAIGASGGYSDCDNPTLITILSELSSERAGALLEALIAGNAERDSSACARLLADALTQCPTLAGEPTRAAAQALLLALPSEPPGYSFRHGPAQQITPDLITATLAGLERIDADLAEQALKHFLERSDVYHPDQTLIPAALSLHAGDARLTSDTPIAKQLHDTMVALLRQRIAEPLEPPADWRRPAQLRCHCTHCEELSRFLDSPSDPTWHLKAAQKTRDHVTQQIRGAQCDLDLQTEKRGSPHTLICKKNQASYSRRLQARERDSDALHALLGPAASP